MFEDYQFKQIHKFASKVKRVCLDNNGVFLAQSSNSIIISHLNGCREPIQLKDYYKNQLNLVIRRCSDMIGISQIEKNKQRSSFAMIIDSKLWLVIINASKKQQNQPIQLQIEKVKLIMVDNQGQVQQIRFINSQNCDKLIILQRKKDHSINIVQYIPETCSLEKLTDRKLKKLQLGRQNENLLQQFPLMLCKNMIYNLNTQKLLLYNQLPSENTLNHYLFIYGLPQTKHIEQNQTFSQQILIFPTFQDVRILSDIVLVPSAQQNIFENSIILLFYQLSNGLQIIQTNYNTPGATLRKFIYLDVHLLSIIKSSINRQQIYLKGIQQCLSSHTILVQSCKGISQSHFLALLSLPSTGTPGTANQVPVDKEFYCLKATNQFFIINTFDSLVQIKKIGKQKIYRSMLRFVGKESSTHLNTILNQILCFLE